jgi:hypothetical protein
MFQRNKSALFDLSDSGFEQASEELRESEPQHMQSNNAWDAALCWKQQKRSQETCDHGGHNSVFLLPSFNAATTLNPCPSHTPATPHDSLRSALSSHPFSTP